MSVAGITVEEARRQIDAAVTEALTRTNDFEFTFRAVRSSEGISRNLERPSSWTPQETTKITIEITSL